ncbi:MAG TPA: POTRA domain-containing protein [Steroidobacteraceae bacterium]|nr:POTRA domain-containing protein [Steroidobacteraceae bacterium]
MALCLLLCPCAYAQHVTIEVRGVDEELRNNVLAYLSFSRYRKSAAELNADTVERLHNRVEREVQAALRPFGYYEPQVQSDVSAQGKGDWRVTVDINPGKPILIESISVRVEGPGESDPLFQRILTNLPLKAGDRLNHADYESIKSDLQRTAATYGYFDARLVKNELLVDPPNYRATIALELDTGARYRFGTTTIEQSVVKDSLVRSYVRYHQGDPYDLTQVLRTQFALDDSQYFSNLEVLPGTPDRNALTIPVTIHADPSRRHRYSFAAGYSTDTGIRGTLGFEDRHINQYGHRFTAELQASQVQRYAVQVRYIVPIGDPAVENFTAFARIEQETLGDVDTSTQSLGPSITKVTTHWQYVGLVTAMHTSGTDLNGTMSDSLLVPEVDIARVPVGYLGEPLFERPLYVTIKGSTQALGAGADFLQLHLQSERVFPIVPKWHLLLRGEAGATIVQNFDAMPTVLRFFAGGINSVRGFAYNSLSPTQPVCATGTSGANCEPTAYIKVGGKDVITGTVEVIRDLPKNLGIATFFDFGNAFNSLPAQLQYSAGIGLRVRLPVLTLGVDLAEPLSVSAGPRLQINFSPKL